MYRRHAVSWGLITNLSSNSAQLNLLLLKINHGGKMYATEARCGRSGGKTFISIPFHQASLSLQQPPKLPTRIHLTEAGEVVQWERACCEVSGPAFESLEPTQKTHRESIQCSCRRREACKHILWHMQSRSDRDPWGCPLPVHTQLDMCITALTHVNKSRHIDIS